MTMAPSSKPPAISKRDLVIAANRLLSSLESLQLTSKTGANDVFEYWLWARSLKMARQPSLGLNVRLEGVSRGKVRLRTSPSSVSTGSFSYAKVDSLTASVELHTGIYVVGGSGTAHEVDVAVIQAGAGRTTRLSYADFRWGIEAKLYAASKALPLAIPRAVLGTAYDLKALPAYRRRGPPGLALVSSARLSTSGRRLLAYRSNGYPRVAVVENVTVAASVSVDVFLREHLASF
jgi:hypothetical protein